MCIKGINMIKIMNNNIDQAVTVASTTIIITTTMNLN